MLNPPLQSRKSIPLGFWIDDIRVCPAHRLVRILEDAQLPSLSDMLSVAHAEVRQQVFEHALKKLVFELLAFDDLKQLGLKLAGFVRLEAMLVISLEDSLEDIPVLPGSKAPPNVLFHNALAAVT